MRHLLASALAFVICGLCLFLLLMAGRFIYRAFTGV
jgi:hypothetical protein